MDVRTGLEQSLHELRPPGGRSYHQDCQTILVTAIGFCLDCCREQYFIVIT